MSNGIKADVAIQDNKNKARIEWIDTAKGICILLVVLHHVTGFYETEIPLQSAFSAFRMPLYFVLSGLFFKQYLGGGKEFLIKKINNLIVPYVFFFITLSIVIPILSYKIFNFKIHGYENYGFEAIAYIFSEKIIANPSIWFLLCLFEVNILFFLITQIANQMPNKNISIFILCSIFGMLGSFSSLYNWCGYAYHMYYLDTAMTALPFFWFGYFLNHNTPFFTIKNTYRNILFQLLIISISVVFIVFFRHGICAMICNEYGGIFGLIELYPYGILGTISVLTIARFLGHRMFLSFIGRYSIIVLCTHVYLIQFSSIITSYLCVEDYKLISTFAITIFLCVPTIILLKKLIPQFTAQKPLFKYNPTNNPLV